MEYNQLEYLSNCAIVLNQTNGSFPFIQDYCPSDCQDSLNAFIAYVYPNQVSTDFCQCESKEWYDNDLHVMLRIQSTRKAAII